MSEKPISPLRQRMLEDMNVRRFTPDTQREYVRAVKRLAAFVDRTPDTATAEELRTFQVHLTETGVRPPTINATVMTSPPSGRHHSYGYSEASNPKSARRLQTSRGWRRRNTNRAESKRSRRLCPPASSIPILRGLLLTVPQRRPFALRGSSLVCRHVRE